MSTARVILIFLLNIIVFIESLKFSSLDTIYQKGVDAYTKERWSECIVQFEETLHLYKSYKAVIINCRLKCKSGKPKNQLTENVEDLHIFEFFFVTRDCINECLYRGFEDVHMHNNVSDAVLTNLQSRKPYAYLHICYFQMNALPKAASAAYTYLVAHSDDNEMKNNVVYYTELPEVNMEEVMDLESDDYKILYKLGIQAYKLKKWGETVNNMEEVISHYLSWENTCRAECERQPEQEWSPEFVITISNNIASVLTCRQKCQDELKPFYNSGLEMLADVLNYLQISYYHLDRLDDAAKAVASYLVLLPTDEDMLENKNIYQTIVDKKSFIERSDIVYYLKRDVYEKDLLNYFHKEDGSDPNANSI